MSDEGPVLSLRILHLEDSRRDAELVRESLDDAGFDLQLDWAVNEAQFTAFLQQGGYDLVLADYHLPSFDGHSALKLAQAFCPGAPFICVSGAIGEERAVELLKQGATDYVLKDHLKKLPMSVRRARKEVSEQQARRAAEEQMARSLGEKEALLRELYHRTKNNMAVIIALLELQSEYFADKKVRDAFQAAENRIRSMALVHQKLYEASDLSHINLKEYIHSLVALLMTSFGTAKDQITFLSEVEDALVLIDTAVPCGLILNELISNALKHAFPGGRNGQIRVSLRRLDCGELQLCVADNGAGLPPGFDLRRDGRMGLQTVFCLAESQLDAQVHFLSETGLTCQLQFKDDFYLPRV